LPQAGVMNAEIFNKYIENVRREYATGVAREHAYRPALKELFESLEPGTIAINDPARQKVGAPDFQIENANDHQLRQHKIFSSPPLAFVEHKDVTEDLDKPEHQSQLKRYLRLGNVLHTNGLIFRFYIKDQKPIELTLAELTPTKSIVVDSAQYNQLALAYHNLVETKALTVKTPLKLATLMAERAQAIRDIIEAALKNDLQNEKDTELTNQFRVFKSQLVHDLDEHKFADLYAQTLAYGLFAARYNDKSLGNFTLVEAAKIMPPTNRFLRKFFQEIAGYESESRINWVLDNLVEVFNRVNVKELMRGAGEEWAKHHDPIIHFYETFLGLYDPQLRKSMGVYYTPQPIVKYIVHSVDEILKKDFGIIAGLADDSKVDRDVKGHPMTAVDKKRGYSLGKKLIHKVQILDPALGTGTFLNEVIKDIARQVKPRLGSGWSKYVEQDLLPRLYGFELMMAPYAMANLRLNMTLSELNYRIIDPNARFRVLLTNSLETPTTDELNQMQFVGFQQILATEAQEADVVKSNHNVMVVVGNPPYSGISSNETPDINKFVEKYKVEPGGKTRLQERKHWLNDDYVKFIAFAEDMIAKNGEGVVAMITNNGYLDNPTFRGMRWHLAKTFDKIYVLDLHGNSKKKEVAPDGSKDENVFNIMQGVGIILAIKTNAKRPSQLAEVYHSELFGKREIKFKNLAQSSTWNALTLDGKNLYFVPKDTTGQAEYDKGTKIDNLFRKNVTGIVTARDAVVIGYTPEEIEQRMKRFVDSAYSDEETRHWLFPTKKAGKYPPGDSRGWKLPIARQKVSEQMATKYIQPIAYRPFDNRFIYYSPEMVDWGRFELMPNFLKGDNLGLIVPRQPAFGEQAGGYITNNISAHKTFSAYNINYSFPLYLYHDDGTKTAILT